MKRLIFIAVIFTLILSGCKKENTETNRELTRLEKEEAGIASGVRNDTIFLDFYFGMTEKQVNQKFKELLKSKKVYISNQNEYSYNFSFDFPKKATANFKVKYFDGNLYEMIITVRANEIIDVAGTVHLQLLMLLRDKFGFNYFEEKSVYSKETNEYSDYYWISGNQRIELKYSLFDSEIIYTDLIAEKKLDEETKKLDNKKRQDINNDL